MSDPTPKQAAETAHRLAVETAARRHPHWSTRDFAEYWGDVNHATVSRWFRRYGVKTKPRYGRPHQEGGPPEMVLRFPLADPFEVVLIEHSDDGVEVEGPWLLCGERVIKGEPHANGVVFQLGGSPDPTTEEEA